MATLSDALGALRRLAGRAWEWQLRDLFGRDYFISYARRGGAPYAVRLARLLGERHAVYLDQLDASRGRELPLRLRLALRRASVLVLLGSAEAVRSASVRRELELFLSTGRTVLLVDVGGELAAAPWTEPPWDAMVGLHPQPESRRAFEGGEVSEDVLAYLRDSFIYKRQETRLLHRALLAVTIIVLAAVLAGAAMWFANDARTKATRATDEARMATDAQKQAEARVTELDGQARAANELANAARTEAASAQGDAAEAREREADAVANTARQERVAASLRLASESSQRLVLRPDLALLLAAHAIEASATAAARRALFDAVSDTPALEAIVLDAHDIAIDRMAVSRDGRTMATLDTRGGLVVWHAGARRGIPLVAPRGSYRGAVAFSPSGNLLAVSDTETTNTGPIDLWDLRHTPARRRRLPMSGYLMSFVSESMLAVESGPGNGFENSIGFWDIGDPASPVRRADRLAVAGSVRALLSDPERGLLIVRDAVRVMVCRAPCDTGRPLPDVSGDALVPGVAVSDGRRPLIAAMGLDATVRIWDLETGQEERRIQLRKDELERLRSRDVMKAGLAFGAGGTRLAVAFPEGIALYDLASTPRDQQPPARVLTHRSGVVALAFMADGALTVARADGGVAFLGPERTVPAAATYAYPADLREIFDTYDATANADRLLIARSGKLFLWPPGASRTPQQLMDEAGGGIWEAAISNDGQAIAGVRSTTGLRQSTLILWDGSGRERYRTMLSDTNSTQLLEFFGTGENRTLAVMLETGAFILYDVRDLSNPRVRVRTTLDETWLHAFDPRGRRLAWTAKGDITSQTVRVRNFSTGRVDVFEAGSELGALAFTRDDRTLVGFGRGALWRWDLSRPGARPSRLVLYSDRELEAPTRTGLIPRYVELVALSIDAALLAFVEAERAIVLWDLEQGLPLGTLSLPREAERIGFSPDGTRMLVFDANALTIIDLDPKRLAAHACALATRGLTKPEMEQFRIDRPLPSVCERAGAAPTRR